MRDLNILLVDDNRDLVDSLSDFFKLKGHDVDIAMTANEGISAAGKKNYDAVLLDIGLPDINGVSAMHSIKQAKPETRILLITGFSRDEVKREFDISDTLPVMTKPLDLEAMMVWLDPS